MRLMVHLRTALRRGAAWRRSIIAHRTRGMTDAIRRRPSASAWHPMGNS